MKQPLFGKNLANEARFELTHNPIFGWKGTFGAQVTAASLNATEVGTGSYAIVPQPKQTPMPCFGLRRVNGTACKVVLV